MVELLNYKVGKFISKSDIEIDILNLNEDMIVLDDISSGLANICRFGGQVNNWYSIAQHSILVSDLAPEELKLEALFHDAAEAYIGDVIKPLKHILDPLYGPIEENFQQIIFNKFNLDCYKLKYIKEFDIKALQMEKKALKDNDFKEWNSFWKDRYFTITPHTMSPTMSNIVFIDNYKKLIATK